MLYGPFNICRNYPRKALWFFLFIYIFFLKLWFFTSSVCTRATVFLLCVWIATILYNSNNTKKERDESRSSLTCITFLTLKSTWIALVLRPYKMQKSMMGLDFIMENWLDVEKSLYMTGRQKASRSFQSFNIFKCFLFYLKTGNMFNPCIIFYFCTEFLCCLSNWP